jgi:8-oxo-dGTP diphosphatase
MNHTEIIVRLLIQKENKVLLCKSKKMGHYYLPGGHVEFGDSLEKTIYKEISEELGLTEGDLSDISFKNYLENTYDEDDGMHHEINFIFKAVLKDYISIESKEDHIEFTWFDLEETKNINLLPKGILQI